jgi:hypothetical protein
VMLKVTSFTKSFGDDRTDAPCLYKTKRVGAVAHRLSEALMTVVEYEF